MPSDDSVRALKRDECIELLKESSFGRLATAAAGVVDIFPINYFADGTTILLRTAPGTKLLEMMVNETVAFETDWHGDAEAWSVVVRGRARLLESQTEIDEAERAPLRPWIPTLKYRFVRIAIDEVSGRRFRMLPEPERG